MTDPNFPAAHSMDTTWFAVDQDGRVARFDSGEAGAVPTSAATGGGAAEPSFDALLLEVACVLERLASEPSRKRTFDHPRRAVLVCEPVARDPVADYRTSATKSSVELGLDATIVRESGPRVLVTRKALPPSELEKLDEHPDVRLLVTADEIEEWIDDGLPGLYEFGHDDQRYGEPGAYRREAAPKTELRIEGVPEIVRKDVESLRLPVRFDEVETLQLADYVKEEDATSWGETTLRGEPRPRPVAPRKKSRAGLVFLLLLAAGLVALLLRRR